METWVIKSVVVAVLAECKLYCFVSDGKVEYLKTLAVAVTVLDCKQNVSFIVFHKVVYFTKKKRIYHFC